MNNYPYYTGPQTEALQWIYGFLIVFVLIAAVILLAAYIVNGWSMMQVARDKGEPTWLAWVPVANAYLLFKVARGKLWILITLIYVPIQLFVPDKPETLFLAILGLIGSILAIWYSIYQLMLMYRLGNEYGATKAFFWIGFLILPFMFAYLIQTGKGAKKNYNIKPIDGIIL